MSELFCNCGCHNNGPHGYHLKNCPMREHVDSIRSRLENADKRIEHDTKIIDRWILNAVAWEGKFHAVKRENNALRKRLYPNK